MYEKYSALLEKTHKTSYQVSKDTDIGQNVLEKINRVNRSEIKV